ncbi:MAG: hypothetical protein IJO31_00715 [Oscillospiraceae bacterium]|jgi:cell division protein FtsB|nr:hypothetical protein [Oscillospiraceae bacterium]
MLEFQTPIGKVKVVRRRSRLLTKVVVLAAVLLSVATLLTLLLVIQSTRAQTEALKTEAVQLNRENSRLELYIQELGTIKGIIRIAQEELGLIEPDSIILDPE